MYALVCVLFCIFSFAADDSLSGSPALDANGTVYIGDWGGTLYAVNGSSGVLLWRYRKALGAFKGSPAITANGTIVIGSLDGAVYGISGALGFSVCLRRITFTESAIDLVETALRALRLPLACGAHQATWCTRIERVVDRP
jgi:hypothetical protein